MIALPRDISYIIVEVACMLFGVGAVLMASDYPLERIRYAAADAHARLIVDPGMVPKMLGYSAPAAYAPVPKETPAVAIYTSGSTGNPKGILHDQESVYSLCIRNCILLEPVPSDVQGLAAPFTFIAGCACILYPLTAGAREIIIPKDVVTNPHSLAAFIDHWGITTTFMPPKVLKIFQETGSSLRLVLTGSERLSGVGTRRYPIYNIYGMSETGSGVAAFRLDRAYDNTPIGRELSLCKVYLVDESGRQAPEGEICVAGHFMTGYIGLPEKTAEVKVPNPWFAEDGYPYMIRTGDLGKRDENGSIVYVNRKDWMIKLNGQRVEPGEIEAALRAVPGVKDTAVKGFDNDRGQTYLCAYYVAESHLYLLLDFSHAISDGTMIMRMFSQLFRVIAGEQPDPDYYYLFLQGMAEKLGTEEAASDLSLLSSLYDAQATRFPRPDFDSRENSNSVVTAETRHTLGEYQAAAARENTTLGAVLVAAGLVALSRYNNEPKALVEWIYNGRDEKWKEDLVGMTISGVPAAMDLSKCATREAILAEAKRQNELGLRYAEYSYALKNMSPTVTESLKIVYEHGIVFPDNMPEGFGISPIEVFTGMLGLYQIIINESETQSPLLMVAAFQGTRYKEESGRRMLDLYMAALDELLFPQDGQG